MLACQAIGSRALAVQAASQGRRRGRPAGGVLQQQPGHDREDRQRCGGEEERGLVADVGVELDGRERADRGAAHAGPEDADGQTTTFRREPGVDERDADRERRAGDAEEESADQQGGVVGLPVEADEQDRDDGGERRRSRTSRGRRTCRSAHPPGSGRASRRSPGRPRSARPATRSRTPSVPLSRNTGPSGLSSAHAQKLIANPMVARPSISHGRRGSRSGGATFARAVTDVPVAGASPPPR